jgi:peptidoglycan-associated lipoprotein
MLTASFWGYLGTQSLREYTNNGNVTRVTEHIEPGGPADFAIATGGDQITFPPGTTDLTDASKAILRMQANWLRQYADTRIVVEGVATSQDGSREEQLALTESRAAAVKKYLVSEGIDATRIATTSYGKERPVGTAPRAVVSVIPR